MLLNGGDGVSANALLSMKSRAGAGINFRPIVRSLFQLIDALVLSRVDGHHRNTSSVPARNIDLGSLLFGKVHHGEAPPPPERPGR